MAPCGMFDIYRWFGETYCSHLQGRKDYTITSYINVDIYQYLQNESVFYPKYGSGTVYRIVRTKLHGVISERHQTS
jgi:hypothetical protein